MEHDFSSPFHRWQEHDSCALICSIRKGKPTHGNVKRTLEALEKMGHRSGTVDGEGDGCGVMIDIPRRLWAKYLVTANLNPTWVDSQRFFVAHFFLPKREQNRSIELLHQLRLLFADFGARILLERRGKTRSDVLGKNAKKVEPEFWQIAAVFEQPAPDQVMDKKLFQLQLRVEREMPLYPLSVSRYTAVYKVYGSPSGIAHYFPELSDPDCVSKVTIGHCRYSTNTWSTFERAQPFALLGHNGEINTIEKLRREGQMIGVQLPHDGSDSQDLDRVLQTLIVDYGFSLAEAMEIVFPPVLEELKWLPDDLKAMYRYYRAAFGPFAQGPAAIVSRYADECVFSVDALGLRPLWFAETEKELVFTSERGVLPFETLISEPKPLAPGEKIAVKLNDDGSVEVIPYNQLQWQIYRKWQERFSVEKAAEQFVFVGAALREQESIIGSSFSHYRHDFSSHEIELPNGQLGNGQEGNGFSETETSEANSNPVSRELCSMLPSHDGLTKERKLKSAVMGAFGWGEEEVRYIEAIAPSGNEPIGSLGYDGPLAVLAPEGHNLADYYKEIVAVVTNPSMDRERETEHFNTQTILGVRPTLDGTRDRGQGAGNGQRNGSKTAAELMSQILELETPILVDATYLEQTGLLSREMAEQASKEAHSKTLEEVLANWTEQGAWENRRKEIVKRLSLAYHRNKTAKEALEELTEKAKQAVLEGAVILLLDDGDAFQQETLFIDPHIAIAAVDKALRETWDIGHQENNGNSELPKSLQNLRRRCSIVLRSGALRNLHDLIFAISLGADAVVPYLIFDVALSSEKPECNIADDWERAKRLTNVIVGLSKGLEKVIATMGTHELRGYGKNFASIGIAPEIANLTECKNFYGSEKAAFDLDRWDKEVRRRHKVLYSSDDEPSTSPSARRTSHSHLRRDFRFYPNVWKAAGRAANGECDYREYEERVKALEHEHPIALRHLLDVQFLDDRSQWIAPEKVDIGIGWHDLPFVISSMSFGSQNEVAYRAYAEAAYRLNMLALTGEGGELRDLIGRYPFNRGQQVASGRFGVNAYYCNSSYWLEIKIGQGAKPGEGGHLPGRKVTPKVASVRYAVPGVDLISPNNNHDLYSIEDLAQLISELKTINPKAKVIVKVPIVTNIGVIAVGIAKAGADVINLSGFDGGTGAARTHALKYVGLPAEVGIKEAHFALLQAGIRDQVELWADGGMRTAYDVLKCVLMGANRVGFGTLAMVAIGCTICRGCQLDTCHVGIATQIESKEEATKRGLKRFEPRDFDRAVEGLVNFFAGMGEELKRLTGMLGVDRLQDLVGRSDLLIQTRGHQLIDLIDLAMPAVANGNISQTLRKVYRPLGYTTKLITQVILDEIERNGKCIVYEDSRLGSSDRAIGTHLSGVIARSQIGLPSPKGSMELRPPKLKELDKVELHLSHTIAGNGLGAFNIPQVTIRVEGGAQDGVGKGSCGGNIIILKGTNHEGRRLDGSVGKSFAYGAQRGFFVVQGYADSRACIRLSGADVVFGDEIVEPIDDSQGLINIAAKAHLKGFAFEYMTAGRAVVLGDPGPWICAGMTGGVVYVKLTPELGFDEKALRRRLSKSAKVSILPVDDNDVRNIRELLSAYADELQKSNQWEQLDRIRNLMNDADRWFVKIVPVNQQADQTVSTE
ncbi:MAG: glutamate synthase-related protein [Armatimonadetes bacterium]|nr:glutamate synthase-related protein [Armatimonadota bacterium]MDW8028566.1 glutamate synthase-related protein [Armatimonadota bacterium]